ncbi:MAG: 50S ribosomal protein L17 [Kiritimatiellae bacterium]|nr:50S ribosomal protein L17 [Kiritimatiellia bacterium]MDD4622088.1 50S ribosomal protein L17 [Kiritimatiellia bacterium]
MRHNRVAKKFGRSMSHRKALMSSLVTNLILQSSIKTTLPKAKQARRDAEKMVTMARKGTLAARRICSARLQSPQAVQRLFDCVVPAMDGRNGGYTRILKLGQRRSDGSEMCLLQWVAMPTAPAAANDDAAKAEPGEKKA